MLSVSVRVLPGYSYARCGACFRALDETVWMSSGCHFSFHSFRFSSNVKA